MLRLAENDGDRAREQRLYDELSLVLDGFAVQWLSPLSGDFARAPLAQQFEDVFELSQQEHALAAVWLTFGKRRQVNLHLVAWGVGRTLVRTLDGSRDDRRDAELAIAVRELLGTAYLFEPRAQQSAPVREVVARVEAQAAAGGPVITAPRALSRPWRMHAGGQGRFGLEGNSASSPSWGGLLALTRETSFGVRFGATLDLGAVTHRASLASVAQWRMAAGARASFAQHFGIVEAGPLVTVQAVIDSTRVLHRDDILTSRTSGLVRLGGGFEVILHVLESLAPWLAFEVTWDSHRVGVFIDQSALPVFQTARVSALLTLGGVFDHHL